MTSSFYYITKLKYFWRCRGHERRLNKKPIIDGRIRANDLQLQTPWLYPYCYRRSCAVLILYAIRSIGSHNTLMVLLSLNHLLMRVSFDCYLELQSTQRSDERWIMDKWITKLGQDFDFRSDNGNGSYPYHPVASIPWWQIPRVIARQFHLSYSVW